MSKYKKTILCGMVATIVSIPLSSAFAIGVKYGMTWGKSGHSNDLGIDALGCYGSPASPEGPCNAYHGDTKCTEKLPVLCVRLDGSPRPNYDVEDHCGGVMECAYYRGWARGHIATTKPILGYMLTSASAGDKICRSYFGADWKMLEHHDGKYVSGMDHDYLYGNTGDWNSSTPWPTSGLLTGGWSLFAYGNVRNDTRFWVKVDGQPANCWNSNAALYP